MKYFEQLSLSISEEAIVRTQKLDKDLSKRLPESLTKKEIIDLQCLNMQLVSCNQWLQDFVKDLQEQLSTASKQIELLQQEQKKNG